MPIGGVVLNFVAKTADAIGDTNKLAGSLVNLGKKSGETAGSKGMGGLFKTMAVGLPVAGAVVAGVVGIAGALIDASKAALEHERATSKMNDTLDRIPGISKKARDANEKWIETMQLTTHVAGSELKGAVATLALATGDLGKAQDLATLAWDASVQSGKSYEEVVEAMVEATTGETGALKEQFQWLDAGSDGVLTYAEAMDQLATATGGAAAAAAKKDAWTTLTTLWGLMKDKLAKAFQPSLDRIGEWFSKPQNVKRIQDMLDVVARLGERVGKWLLQQLEKFLDWIQSAEFRRAVITWQVRFQIMKQEIQSFIDFVQTAVHWISTLITWLGRIAGAGPKGGIPMPWSTSAATGPAGVGPQSTASTRAATAPAQPTVIVTEEQVYRAVAQLLLRGAARNGRPVMVR